MPTYRISSLVLYVVQSELETFSDGCWQTDAERPATAIVDQGLINGFMSFRDERDATNVDIRSLASPRGGNWGQLPPNPDQGQS